jgi:hypothetical protein
MRGEGMEEVDYDEVEPGRPGLNKWKRILRR